MSNSRGLPDVLMTKVDEYVDSLAPQIQPRIAAEIDTFQTRTIDSLEDQVIDAFRSLFNKDKPSGDGSRGLNDTPPDAYGVQSLPFADEIGKLTRSFSVITDEAGDDLRDIFNLTEGRGGGPETQSRGVSHTDSFSSAKGFLSSAINVVQDHLEKNKGPGGQSFELDGLLGVLSNTVKDAARNPEEKACVISPEIKEKVGLKLREQHAPIAEQFTRIALDHIKRWLRGNTSTRDLGDGVKGEIEDQVKDLVKGLGGLFGNKKSSQEGTRGIGDRDGEGEGSSGGFSKVISDKLSTGLAKVHREVRLEFRKILGGIEKQLFELLPDAFQRPLEKILGGNPFDSQLDRDAGGNADRGFGDDIKVKLVNKIRGLVRKVQETLRESILGVVNGGHRKFERESWVFVQNIVEQKVQKYLPKVKINVPDDIGNENVSVGAPTAGSQLGGAGGHQSGPPQGANYAPPPPHEQYGGQGSHQQSYNPPPHHEYRPDQHQEYQSHQEYRPNENQPPQSYQQYHSDQHQSYGQNQGYGQGQSYGGNQSYGGGQNYGGNPDHNQCGDNPRY
ncbi:c6 zinc finger domain containing protein [Colletotrichum incanum]|uniref:C6 zinc finger domain containing protein n=1 Tax=Colletotrichum incanum TaxID=1573173 RepID=A0A166LY89_COLIC|nr:c6 zinc finger domain containing protein [Colletotrichum incanum]